MENHGLHEAHRPRVINIVGHLPGCGAGLLRAKSLDRQGLDVAVAPRLDGDGVDCDADEDLKARGRRAGKGSDGGRRRAIGRESRIGDGAGCGGASEDQVAHTCGWNRDPGGNAGNRIGWQKAVYRARPKSGGQSIDRYIKRKRPS